MLMWQKTMLKLVTALIWNLSILPPVNIMSARISSHLSISTFRQCLNIFMILTHCYSFLNTTLALLVSLRPECWEINESFLDFSMPGYSEVSTPTESTAGGVMLYILNCFTFKLRLDLDACLYLPRLLESVFVEIVLPNKPNIIIGVIYRHPCMLM